MSSSTPSNMKLKDAGEFGLIERLTDIMRETLAPGVRGAGDDCAVVPLADNCSTSLVITTDTMVEERHFRWEYTSAYDLGWKLLAVNLSDIAAAGGKAMAAVLTLQLRPDIETSIVEEIYRGAAALAKKHGVSLAGGDTTSSSVVALGATIIGMAERPLSRAGAKLGDDLWVSGPIGLGGLGLALSRGEISAADFPDSGKAARAKYCRPEPRLELGRALSDNGLATAVIDVSDGLIQDAGHIARRSGVGLEIELAHVPNGTSPEKWTILRACTCGDDYELLFSASPAKREELEALSSMGLTRVGAVSGPASGVVIRLPDGTSQAADELLRKEQLRSGFEHFFDNP